MLRDAPKLDADQLSTLMNEVENHIGLAEVDRQQLRDKTGNVKAGAPRYFALFGIIRRHNQKLERVLENLDIDAAIAAVPGLNMR